MDTPANPWPIARDGMCDKADGPALWNTEPEYPKPVCATPSSVRLQADLKRDICVAGPDSNPPAVAHAPAARLCFGFRAHSTGAPCYLFCSDPAPTAPRPHPRAPSSAAEREAPGSLLNCGNSFRFRASVLASTPDKGMFDVLNYEGMHHEADADQCHAA